MAVELRIPSAGESITEVQVGAWHKREGDYVERDEVVAEIETDKASMELSAPAAGVIGKLLVAEGEVVKVGRVITTIEPGDRPAGALKPAVAKTAAATTAAAPPLAKAAGEAIVMPAARRALHEAGLAPQDVTPTGPGGRILKDDVQRRVEQGPAPMRTFEDRGVASGSAPVGGHGAAASTDGYRREEVVPMSMIRRRIAARLVEAKQTAALLTTFNEIDMSAVMTLRKERGEAFQKQTGVKLGLMSFFVKAAIDALKRYPAVNAEVRGTDIVYKNYYDLGVAVSTEQGLIVPVVRDADRLSFAEIEQRIAELAARARDRKVTVEELQGGTFTITNGGVFGSLMATPIINYPQVAILGLHAINDRPVAREGQVVIRPMMYVALTYDHRVIDGRESVSFLKRVKECVEDPARMLLEV
jgi:2-oxoglutarate dehydrogenase E2 component (dihydrolipoamide succinyltransferase)